MELQLPAGPRPTMLGLVVSSPFLSSLSGNFNPEIPKLEKSISGTSPKREHLHLTVAVSLLLMTLLAS